MSVAIRGYFRGYWPLSVDFGDVSDVLKRTFVGPLIGIMSLKMVIILNNLTSSSNSENLGESVGGIAEKIPKKHSILGTCPLI